MSTLETQYKNWMLKTPNNKLTYVEWLEKFNEIHNLPSDMSDWDVTLNDGLENEPYVSDDFQIGPNGAYEHTFDESTIVFTGEANYSRSAYIKLEENKVIFDCSDGEYGPIVFDVELLKDALNKHTTPNIHYTKPGFVEKRMRQMLEHLASEEFKSVGDEGLFPNHTDKDIWIAGFKAGYLKK